MREFAQQKYDFIKVYDGLSPNPAAFLGTSAESGTVEVGKRADLVLVDANPLQNLEALHTPSGVMLGGKWLSKQQLNELLSKN